MWSVVQQFAAACSNPGFFGIPTWYQYLVGANLMTTDSATNSCMLIDISPGQWPKVIVLVALAVVEILLRLASMIAVGFIIYGGIKYITSNGDPNQSKVAQQTIINALIGVVIAIAASAVVSFIGATFG